VVGEGREDLTGKIGYLIIRKVRQSDTKDRHDRSTLPTASRDTPCQKILGVRRDLVVAVPALREVALEEL